MTHLNALITEYRTVTAALRAAEDRDSEAWSPLDAERQDQHAVRVAREIADLLATQPVLPVLV